MDDVEWMAKNGVEETFIFLADSAKRDKSAFPRPNEYEVIFNSQFRNVVKFEILEVNVPRTDYIIDETENTLVYSIVQPTSINSWSKEMSGNIRTATVSPGDYNLPQLVDELNLSLTKSASNTDTVILQVSPTTNPSEISNKIRIIGSGPFTILGDDSTMRTTLGLGDPVDVSDTTYATVPGYTTNYPNGASGVFLSTPGKDGQTLNAFVGPIPSGINKSYEGIYGNRIISQYFTSPVTGIPISVSAYITNVGVIPQDGHVLNVSIHIDSNDEPVAYGIASVPVITDDYVPLTIELYDVKTNIIKGTTYKIDFEASAETDSENCAALWYALSNLPPVPGARAAVDTVTVHEGNYFCSDLVVGVYGHEITPPGIVNLRGARYIKIRCNEIEQMISRDRVGEPSTAGIAMVNLIGYGYQNSKYDFVHYPTKRFHPIGKLQKLTFRLERPDGTLYNTQGVDNSFLCALTYISTPNTSSIPAVNNGPGTRPAAPMYTGDFIQIQQHRWSEEDKATKNHKKATYGGCRPTI